MQSWGFSIEVSRLSPQVTFSQIIARKSNLLPCLIEVLTRMRQDESVASEGSSFTRELGRLHRAISMSTKRSLVILDEVGRECRSDGESKPARLLLRNQAHTVVLTRETCCFVCADGAGLFIATIYEFLQRGQECPVVLSATHHLRELPERFLFSR